MEPALESVCKDVRIGKILIQTNEDTHEPEVGYISWKTKRTKNQSRIPGTSKKCATVTEWLLCLTLCPVSGRGSISKVEGHWPKGALSYMTKIKRFYVVHEPNEILKIWSLHNVRNGLYYCKKSTFPAKEGVHSKKCGTPLHLPHCPRFRGPWVQPRFSNRNILSLSFRWKSHCFHAIQSFIVLSFLWRSVNVLLRKL
jgi:hypothetical protein